VRRNRFQLNHWFDAGLRIRFVLTKAVDIRAVIAGLMDFWALWLLTLGWLIIILVNSGGYVV